jgi:hypothetical protein
MQSQRSKRKSQVSQDKRALSRKSDDFLSVARRLECDEDKRRFEAKLAKIAKTGTGKK